MKTTGNGWNNQYTYTYDSMGNIATVSYGGKTTKYTYDSLNRLTREDDQAAGKNWVYAYDSGGNITSAKEYAYTIGTLGRVQSTKAYTYGDSNWKDKLTSYAGSNITYDAIGNPLSYRGMTFTWEAGSESSYTFSWPLKYPSVGSGNYRMSIVYGYGNPPEKTYTVQCKFSVE